MAYRCIKCQKEIDRKKMYCPYCGRQQYPKVKQKTVFTKPEKNRPLYSDSEIVTAFLKKDDKDYIDFLFTRLL